MSEKKAESSARIRIPAERILAIEAEQKARVLAGLNKPAQETRGQTHETLSAPLARMVEEQRNAKSGQKK